jgi:cytochrome c peroxidase
MLYLDPRLSESHTLSCNSCHSVLGHVSSLDKLIREDPRKRIN